ncbi:MAG: hypothetical protein K8F33_06820 [Thermomonas sp.]|uniref:hypothetical protein n=1 Tax=Thermomonas sp. TaxID=1971895 RepID=UPI001D3ADF6C|nr:hypothetical protein [Thermomonas sp.]MBZ0087792.1 hypothetical protein [Thermomonas sp.]
MTFRGISKTALIIMLLSTSAAALAADGPKIERIQARLFYSHSGSLSAPITPDAALWNVIIGEGDASEPSESTLVDVILRGEPGDYPPGVLDIVVTETRSGKVVLKRTSALGIFSAQGRFHVPVWLSDTGCIPLTVKASLRGGGGSRASLDIPFHCGE